MSFMTRLKPDAELIMTSLGGRMGSKFGRKKGRLDLGGRRLAMAMCLATLAYALLAYGSIMLTRGDGVFAAVWMPNAIALALLLHLRPKRAAPVYLAIFLGSLSANAATRSIEAATIGFSIANMMEVIAASYFLRKLGCRKPKMERMEDLAQLVFSAGIIAPAISATIAAISLASAGGDFASAWADWYIADALGMILITPILLIMFDTLTGRTRVTVRHPAEWTGIIAGGFILTSAVFIQSDYPLLFIVLPGIAFAAFRLGVLGTAIALLQVAVTSTIFTWQGHGPIMLASNTIGVGLIVLQVFLATGFVMGLPIAAAVDGRRSATERLRLREAQLALLANNVSDAVMSYDSTGLCVYASPSVREVLAEKPSTFVGKRPSDRVHPDARERVEQAQRRLVNGTSETERFTYRRFIDGKDGKPCYIEANCRLITADNANDEDSGGIIVSCRDVTQRVDLEHKLVRARRHAENAAHAKSEFLANMSHEIRTPMNGVLGFADLLLKSDLPVEARRHVELIEESGKSMMRLLNDILDISKIEAGRIVVSEEPVNLCHLLSGCLKLHTANAAQKGVELVWQPGPSLPPMVVTDGLRLRQIIHNLLGNAVKFTGHGSVTLQAGADGGTLAIAIEDTGIGIDPARIAAIFGQFEQADKTTSRRFGGTGLGLAISRQLAELLGGTLEAASPGPSGSRFELRIPLVVPAAVTPGAGPSPEPKLPDGPQTMPAPSRILLAEDHDINRILATAMLERCGQTVEIAADGKQAVAAALAAHDRGQPFQLVLMDVQMPECDGYEATRSLRAAGFTAEELPIVALTANAYEEDIKAALESGMQAHLAKPLVFGSLVQVLQRWLPMAAAADASAAERNAGVDRAQDNGCESSGDTLQTRWLGRRGEALAAVRLLVGPGKMSADQLQDIARTVHKLAGTAGMFGEGGLGEMAGQLERAIKTGAGQSEYARLAEDLLQAA
ncbi:MASE1 domain-containing protein [Altererythrobacter aquiaggeris]|uniref:MASE1 domain-containing protein n=1 Tax=Aestuarierythrobacter aquiaggeris TaxID=1898396 RepID=UPI003017A552